MALIDNLINKILTATFGKDIRSTLAEGLDAVNKETESTTARQEVLESTFTQLIIDKGNTNAEIVAARVDSTTNTPYDSLPLRLDGMSSVVNEKADKSFVEVVLASAVSGAPKVFFTLAALKSAYPTGTTGIFLVLDDNCIYVWDPKLVTWINAGIYQGVRIGRNIINPENTTFITTGKNLFNKDTAVSGYYIEGNPNDTANRGKTVALSGRYAGYFMPISGGKSYYLYDIETSHYAFYDENFVFISGDNGTGNIVVAPANASYLRVTVNSTSKLLTAQVEEGTNFTGYEPYRFVMKYFTVGSTNIMDKSVLTNHIKDKVVQPKHMSDVTLGKNKFNKNTAKAGYYISATDGQEKANTGYSAGEFEEIDPSTSYFVSYGHQIAFYNSAQVFASGVNLSAQGANGATFITPANAAFIRVTVPNDKLSTYQLEKGTVKTDYEDYGLVKWNNLQAGSIDLKKVYGSLDIVIPRKIYLLKEQLYNFYYENFIKCNNPMVYSLMESLRGDRLTNGYKITPTSVETFNNIVHIKNMNLETLKNKTLSVEVIDRTVKTDQVGVLQLGDSISRDGEFVRVAQNVLTNVKSVGTRTYDNGLLNREGRGGWTLADYFNKIGSTTTVDSPFLFPVGVEGAKYWGNTEQWRKVCYDDISGYDYAGFQKIAKGWNGTDYLFDTNGYPKSPAIDDVVIDPTKPAGSQFLKWDGASWQVKTPQPTVEFNFSKYMARFAAAFDVSPTIVSFLLGTNDFTNTIGIDQLIDSYLTNLRAAITSIKSYNPAIKVIVNIPMLGKDQEDWSKDSKTVWNIQYNRNMQDLGLRLIKEFDTDTELVNGIYVCPLNMVLAKSKLQDRVHPTSNPSNPTGTGHEELGLLLAGFIQKIR